MYECMLEHFEIQYIQLPLQVAKRNEHLLRLYKNLHIYKEQLAFLLPAEPKECAGEQSEVEKSSALLLSMVIKFSECSK